MLWSAVSTKVLATDTDAFGWLVTSVPWRYVGLIWGYYLVWVFIEDWTKLIVYGHMGLEVPRHGNFLDTVKKGLHSHAR